MLDFLYQNKWLWGAVLGLVQLKLNNFCDEFVNDAFLGIGGFLSRKRGKKPSPAKRANRA